MALSQATAMFLFLGQRQSFEGQVILVFCSLSAQQK